MQWNGTQRNGMDRNATQRNGTKCNGMGRHPMAWNSLIKGCSVSQTPTMKIVLQLCYTLRAQLDLLTSPRPFDVSSRPTKNSVHPF